MIVQERSRDYVAFMQCAATSDWVPAALTEVRSWLREKGFDVDPGEAGDHELDGVTLALRPQVDAHGADVRMSLVEPREGGGTWTSDLILHAASDGPDWVSLTVRNSDGDFVSVPRLARYLMGVLPLGDGLLRFRDEPHVFHAADVPQLIALLADETRNGLVFVVGSDDAPGTTLGPFVSNVRTWAREIYGLAQFIVLDPAATAAFTARVGEAFAAQPWTIRTYHPGVRFTDPHDARRHRILSTSHLSDTHPRTIQRLLGDIARQQASIRPEHPSLVRVRRRFARLETLRLTQAVEAALPAIEDAAPVESVAAALEASTIPQAPTDVESRVGPEVVVEPAEPAVAEVPAEASRALTETGLVRRILGLKEITESALRDVARRLRRRDRDRDDIRRLTERVDELQARLEESEDETAQLAAALDDEQMEKELALLDLDDSRGRMRWLEARLRDHQDYEAAHLDDWKDLVESRPGSFTELLDRIETLEGVSFTGDAAEVEKLGQFDTNDAALRRAWEAVLVMHDYARARRTGDWDRSLADFIATPPDGYRTFPSSKFAESETGATMRAHGEDRVFPVPVEVDPSGQAVMKAHVKLAQIGTRSPRMHVFDGHPAVPCIYIGYIGTHLRLARNR